MASPRGRVRVRALFAGFVFACGATACTRPTGAGVLHPGETITGEITQDDLATPADFSGYPGDGEVPPDDASGDAGPVEDAGSALDAGATSVDDVTNADTYTLDLAAGQSVQVVMCRADQESVLDPYLIVDFGGVHLLADDDSAGDLDARVQIDAVVTGRYTVYAAVVTGRVAQNGGRAYVIRAATTDVTAPLECTGP